MVKLKKKLDEDQLKARRRNKMILEADIIDTEMEIRDNEFMVENKVPEKRLRKQLALAKAKLENLQQNLKMIEKDLRAGYVEYEEQPAIPQPVVQ